MTRKIVIIVTVRGKEDQFSVGVAIVDAYHSAKVRLIFNRVVFIFGSIFSGLL